MKYSDIIKMDILNKNDIIYQEYNLYILYAGMIQNYIGESSRGESGENPELSRNCMGSSVTVSRSQRSRRTRN